MTDDLSQPNPNRYVESVTTGGTEAMSKIYICPDHHAEWDAMRQGYYCPKCDQRWTEHDIPGLQRQLQATREEIERQAAQLRIAEYDRECLPGIEVAYRVAIKRLENELEQKRCDFDGHGHADFIKQIESLTLQLRETEAALYRAEQQLKELDTEYYHKWVKSRENTK